MAYTDDGPRLIVGDIFVREKGSEEPIQLVSMTQAAEMLGVSEGRIRRAIKSGIIRGGRMGRDFYAECDHVNEIRQAGGFGTLGIRSGPKERSPSVPPRD